MHQKRELRQEQKRMKENIDEEKKEIHTDNSRFVCSSARHAGHILCERGRKDIGEDPSYTYGKS